MSSTASFKPMLSATVEDVHDLKFPLLASAKLDGIRAVVIDGTVYSRNLKPIPNKRVQRMFGRPELNGLDGELIHGLPGSASVFRDTTSAVMSVEGQPEVTFYGFDYFKFPDQPFTSREAYLRRLEVDHLGICALPQVRVETLAALAEFEASVLADGYEGVMLRAPSGRYKFGRSTMREGALMKLKQFADAEAQVLGFEEQMHNVNELKLNALGQAERSSKKEGLVGKGTLGALRVRGVNGPYKGVVFNVGTGFDDALRAQIWSAQPDWLGATVTYKYFPTGSKDAPRFPVYLRRREDL